MNGLGRTILFFISGIAVLFITAGCSGGGGGGGGGASAGAAVVGWGGSGLAPSITSVSPVSASMVGGDTLTVNGSNFIPGVTVTVGTASCNKINVSSTAQLTCVLSSSTAPGAYDVVVNNPIVNQSARLAAGFSYYGFLYVSDESGAAVSAFQVNPSNGNLTELSGSPYTVGSTPYGVVATANRKFLYVANYGDGTISGFSINSSTGQLTAIPGSPFSDGAGADAAVVSGPNDKYLYICHYGSPAQVGQMTINPSTGALSSPVLISTTGQNCGGIIWEPTQRFLYAANWSSNNVTAYSMNSSTGALTMIGVYDVGASPDGINLDASGTYVVTGGGNSNATGVQAINSSTGALTSVPGSPFATPANINSSGVAVSPNNAYVVASNQSSSSVSIFSFNPSTGVLSNRNDVNIVGGTNPNSLIMDTTGQFVYSTNTASNNLSLFTLNQTTGTLTYQQNFNTGAFPAIAWFLK